MKADEVYKSIYSNMKDELDENHFKEYKGKALLRVINEVVQIVKISCHKHDIHMWYAVYPLFEKNIWFGAATNATCGRYPVEEKTLKVTDSKSLKEALKPLQSGLTEILAYFNERNTVNKLGNSISKDDLVIPKLVKAYCLSKLGEYEEANVYLSELIDSNLGSTYKEGAIELLNAIQENEVITLFESYKAKNIKKLSLKKYVQV